MLTFFSPRVNCRVCSWAGVFSDGVVTAGVLGGSLNTCVCCAGDGGGAKRRWVIYGLIFENYQII